MRQAAAMAGRLAAVVDNLLSVDFARMGRYEPTGNHRRWDLTAIRAELPIPSN